MQVPLDVTFRHMEPSAALDAAIRERVAKLEQFCDRIIGCHVVVEAPHKHHHKGNLFHIRIDVTVPGKEIVVKRAPDAHQAHEDAYVALRDAFDGMRRQLEDYMRVRRGKVKSHAGASPGRVAALYPDRDYGTIETPQGREIYFHRHSVLGGSFDDLGVGARVRFTEEAGDEGPQAASVHIVSKGAPGS